MKGVKNIKKVVNNLLNCSKINTDMYERYLNCSNMYYIIYNKIYTYIIYNYIYIYIDIIIYTCTRAERL